MSDKINTLKSITSEVDIFNLQKSLSTVVCSSNEQGVTLIKQDAWVAVPVESGYHFDNSDQERLLHAITYFATTRLFAITLEYLDASDNIIEIPLSRNGIAEFNRQYGHFNVVLFPELLNWVVICTTDDYFIVIGNQQFVEKVVGHSIEESFVEFRIFATDIHWPELVRQKLLIILNILENEYQYAQRGASVVLK